MFSEKAGALHVIVTNTVEKHHDMMSMDAPTGVALPAVFKSGL